MKNYLVHRLTTVALIGAAAAITGALSAEAQTSSVDETVASGGPAPTLELTPAQRSAIYQEVHQDKSKLAPSRFPTNVGAEVPPMIELYMLPDDILAANPETKLYKYTRVGDRIVLVDPTNMRVIAVIGPEPAR
ncbi:MAG TPA: DUF1236 domain-containing protein [Xanthobacteraceae bacterium]|nr:DUF1236 domain-containing protein [Xanthobacteraceae bacterium]